MSLAGKNIIVGICGGIAAYKIPNFIRRLIKEGAQVQAVLTRNGEHFVGKAALATITQKKVITAMFVEPDDSGTEHVSIAGWAHALLVAPATANTIAKFACGIADDFLSTAYLSIKAPVILAPSMNDSMWNHPATQQNLHVLKKRGVHIIEPESGELACRTTGKGRLPADETLIFHVRKALSQNDLSGKKILITCGGTQEAIDPVRSISNSSSGKMGIALAIDALERGAEVTLVCGTVSAAVPPYVKTISVKSSSDMLNAVKENFGKCDCLVMAAAVADFAPSEKAGSKIKKSLSGLTIELKGTPDILKSIARIKGKRKIVGFALDSEKPIENARKKLKDKNCDLIVANPPASIGGERSAITIVQKNGSYKTFPEMSKKEAAGVINNFIAAL